MGLGFFKINSARKKAMQRGIRGMKEREELTNTKSLLVRGGESNVFAHDIIRFVNWRYLCLPVFN